MSKLLTFLRTEPALITGVVQAGLALGLAAGLNLTATQAGATEAAAAAVLAAIVAVAARPVSAAALTGALAALGTLAMAFGVPHITGDLVSASNAFLVAVLAIVLRGHLTPTLTLKRSAAVS